LGLKPGHPGPVINLAFSGHAVVVPGLRKVVKIGLKLCLVVLIENDKNWTHKKYEYVSGGKSIIWGLFSTFPAPVVVGPEK